MAGKDMGNCRTNHTFVMETTDPYTMYELWWQAVGLDPGQADLAMARCFPDPVTYHVRSFVQSGLDPWSTPEQLEIWLKGIVDGYAVRPYYKKLSLASLTQRTPEEVETYRVEREFEIEQIRSLQSAFSWLKRVTGAVVCPFAPLLTPGLPLPS